MTFQRNSDKRLLFEQGRLPRSGLLLQFLIERLGDRHCEICNLSEWRGVPIPLDIDHIDGNNANHTPSNLRIICPNCHRLTGTWGNCKHQRENQGVCCLICKREIDPSNFSKHLKTHKGR